MRLRPTRPDELASSLRSSKRGRLERAAREHDVLGAQLVGDAVAIDVLDAGRASARAVDGQHAVT